MIPQVIILAIIFMGLGLDLANHGLPKDGKYNFFSSLIASSVFLICLYWGGFFDCFA